MMGKAAHRKGFSLLEMSVALVVVALVVGFGVTGGKNALEGSDRVTAQQRMEVIKKALDNYARLNGYLPCPSRRDTTPTSATFGVESRSGTACTVAGDIKNVPAAPGVPTIYIGGVPVRTLGLPDAYASDSWSNKLLYAVGMNHVGSPSSYANANGPITLRFGNRTGVNYTITTTNTGTPGPSATYVVVSHGPDGKGAYPHIGTAIAKACGTSDNNDVENCDQLDATFYDSEYNEGASSKTFFDDYIVWATNALERNPVTPAAGTTGICLAGGGLACDYAINTPGQAPDCEATCTAAGYTSSGASMTNCTYNASCTQGGNTMCNYQCCCSGQPPAGCAATSTTWGSGNCSGGVPLLPHNGSATIQNATFGYQGSVVATCTNGSVAYSSAACNSLTPTSSSTSSTSASSTSSSSGGLDGCSSGNCERWCAPCTKPPKSGQLCEKYIISKSPCVAHCLYAGCFRDWRNGYICTPCP